MLNFSKDYFEKYYHVLGHITISESFRNNKYYLEILKLGITCINLEILCHFGP